MGIAKVHLGDDDYGVFFNGDRKGMITGSMIKLRTASHRDPILIAPNVYIGMSEDGRPYLQWESDDNE